MTPQHIGLIRASTLPAWLRPLKAGIARSASKRRLRVYRGKKHRTG
jgi:hypothetical protein